MAKQKYRYVEGYEIKNTIPFVLGVIIVLCAGTVLIAAFSGADMGRSGAIIVGSAAFQFPWGAWLLFNNIQFKKRRVPIINKETTGTLTKEDLLS